MDRILKIATQGVGLVFSEKMISVIVIQTQGSTRTLAHMIEEPMPEGAYKDRIPVNPKAIGQALKHLWHKYKLKQKAVFLVQPESFFLRRMMTLQVTSKERIKALLIEKIRRYVIFSGSEPVIDWEFSESVLENGEKNTRVFAVAGIKSQIDTYLPCFSEAGLRMLGITTPVMGLAQAIHAQLPPLPGENAMMIVVSEDRTDLLILNAKKVVFTHTVSVSSSDQWPILLEDLDKTLSKGNWPLQKIIIGCPIDLQASLTESLTRHFTGIPIESAKIPLPIEHFTPDVLQKLSEYLPVIGACGPQKPRINVLPLNDYEEEIKKITMFFSLYIVGFCTCVLGLFFTVWIASYWVQHRISSVQAEINATQKQYLEVMESDRILQEVKTLITSRRGISKKLETFSWNRFFADLPKHLSVGIRLVSLEIKSDNTLYFEGQARSTNDVFLFLRNLKSDPAYDLAEMIEVVQDKQSGLVLFKLKATRKIVSL